jgi:hypothetical protein
MRGRARLTLRGHQDPDAILRMPVVWGTWISPRWPTALPSSPGWKSVSYSGIGLPHTPIHLPQFNSHFIVIDRIACGVCPGQSGALAISCALKKWPASVGPSTPGGLFPGAMGSPSRTHESRDCLMRTGGVQGLCRWWCFVASSPSPGRQSVIGEHPDQPAVFDRPAPARPGHPDMPRRVRSIHRPGSSLSRL